MFLPINLLPIMGKLKAVALAASRWAKTLGAVAFGKILAWSLANPRAAAALVTSTATSLYGFIAGQTAVDQQAAVMGRIRSGIELALTVFA